MTEPTNNFMIYERFNDIICSRSESEQELLSQIRKLNKSAFLSERVKEEMRGYPFYSQEEEKFQEMDYYIDTFLGPDIDSQGLLVSTENAIFNEILGIELQSYKIQEGIAKQRQQRLRIESHLQKLRKDPDLILREQIKREANLILSESEFEKIKVEINEISIKIESIQLLEQDIEGKLQAAHKRNAQLQQKKNILNNQLNRWRTLLPQKNHLEQQEEYTRSQAEGKSKLQRADQQRNMSQEICQMLKERIELQSQIAVQEAEKQQFIRLLINFKERYTEVQHRNNHLKQELKRKGLHLTALQE